MTALQIILLLLVGYILFTIDKKQENFPVPVVLLLAGISLSFIPFFHSIEIDKTIIYDFFLPALLFVSAYRYSPNALREHGGIIAALSTVGLVMTAILFGFMVYVVGGEFVTISLIGSLVIASILTPTDPVSVVSILKQSADNPKVADVVEGESMINDGTSIVLFTVLAGMFINHESFSFFSFLSEFLLVSIGGAILGLFCGWTVSHAVHITHHREFQVMLSIILAYGIFHIAEHIGVSGVLATVASGIMLSWEFEHTNQEDHYREALDGFWGVVEPTILALVFLLIGIEATSYLSMENWKLVLLLFISSLLIRFVIIAGIIQFFPSWRKEIDWREITLISWSGIKGTMSVALLLSLKADVTSNGEVDLLISISFAVVVLSLVIQSLGIYPLSRMLRKD
ncbi:sodium:proton antiporter [Pontibacillus yanchengensis]|uniref:Sodium:proton antiporter n=2 Tax=Pontibacillus yanchengensis TaxID=462910 RepID=A0ACC7VE46_9BACI|nr:sodium:proton antiporter [Pontibacillus yanchengensis]MYL35376.1 sodium:proton antiporter [Pontibacillus yanchengensis]MYL52405.1 sodium:proton antiporter [Pontibacillus yanchengensis]